MATTTTTSAAMRGSLAKRDNVYHNRTTTRAQPKHKHIQHIQDTQDTQQIQDTQHTSEEASTDDCNIHESSLFFLPFTIKLTTE